MRGELFRFESDAAFGKAVNYVIVEDVGGDTLDVSACVGRMDEAASLPRDQIRLLRDVLTKWLGEKSKNVCVACGRELMPLLCRECAAKNVNG